MKLADEARTAPLAPAIALGNHLVGAPRLAANIHEALEKAARIRHPCQIWAKDKH